MPERVLAGGEDLRGRFCGPLPTVTDAAHGAARRAEDDQTKEQSSSARQAHWLQVVRWQQQHRVAIIRSNNRGEAFNPLSASVSTGGSVQHGLSAAGGVHGFDQYCSAADKR